MMLAAKLWMRNEYRVMGILLCLLATMAHTSSAAAEPIRVGWQVSWATQGQLVMGLQHTNIADRYGLDLRFVGFSYGAPLNHAALAGAVDVLLTADQPALVLLSRSPDWYVVGRMMYNRVCIYVPPASKVTEIKQLDRKSIMGPVGAAAERVAMDLITKTGIKISNLTLGNLDMPQQAALLRRAGTNADKWSAADALYGFDPLPAIFKKQKLARILSCGKVVSLVVASRAMIEQRRDELKNFMKSFALSWGLFNKQPRTLNELFRKSARLGDATDDVLDDAASVEPNRWARSLEQISLTLSEADLEIMSQAKKFLVSRKIVESSLDIRKRVETDLIREALRNFDWNKEYKEVQFK